MLTKKLETDYYYNVFPIIHREVSGTVFLELT